jgi:hypothetical protein
MANLPEFMNLRRKALKLTVGKLAVQLNLNPATVHKYLSGVRPLPETRVALFRDTLCPSEELKDEFNSLYEKFQVGRTRSPLELAIDSPEATLRMATLNFWPFAGEKLSSEEDPDNEFNEEVSSKAFMEKFVEKCLSLAVVHLETVDVGRRLPKGQIPFDMNQRIDAVERRKVDFIFNLMSLQRLKRLTFIPVPIRIAVNALVFQTPSADGQEQDFARLSAAKRLLVYGEQPASEPFLVITIANEIGHVFMEQAHGLKEIGKTFRADELHTHCLDPQPTLDAAFLEETMRTRSKHAPVMLVADEHTILSVLGLLKNEAALVLPPNSDQAVIHSVERRIPPAFYFGIGMRRTNNSALIDYLQQTFTACLSVESESIAEWYRDLYYQLVRFVRKRLATTGIYTGGILRTTQRVGDPPPQGADSAEWGRRLATLAEQNARAVARRTLTLSRRSLENLPPEMAPWRPILSRARELIEVKDGGDRGRIREIIFHCARMALGRDPYSHESGSIQLLHELTPQSGPTPADERALDNASVNCPEGQWPDFLYLMELELDMDLSDLRKCNERWFRHSWDLGRLISRIQLLLEASRDSRLVLTIRDFNAKYDLETYVRMRALDAQIDLLTMNSEIKKELVSPNPFVKRILAFRLGETAGFLDAEFLPPANILPNVGNETPYDVGTEIQPHGTILIRRLYVADHLHGGGISRRLIRRIVEEGNDSLQKGIWLGGNSWTAHDRRKFRRAGFFPIDNNRLLYEFKLT